MAVADWKVDLNALKPHAPIFDWLSKPYVISKAMKQCCNTLTVHVISQQEAEVYIDEQKAFEPQNIEEERREHQENRFLVRKVFLQGDGVPWSFGRVVIPWTTYQQFQTTFDGLGGQLIGEHLLYGNPETTRSAFQYVELTPQHRLFQEIHQGLSPDIQSKLPGIAQHHFQNMKTLWGRRSIFTLKNHPLMVTEIYLPTLPPLP